MVISPGFQPPSNCAVLYMMSTDAAVILLSPGVIWVDETKNCWSEKFKITGYAHGQDLE